MRGNLKTDMKTASGAIVQRVMKLAGDLGERVLSGVVPASDAVAQAHGLREKAHRPWPPPDFPWLQGQSWYDLLFAHWPVKADALRAVVPSQLPLDTYAGSAWIGITAFEIRGLRLRGAPPLPLIARFPETNVRTYTTLQGAPGIYFLSLDAASTLAVLGARVSYHLPYARARMSIARSGDEVRYRSRRIRSDASLEVIYQPHGHVFQAAPGTLEHFLIERYCLYTLAGGDRIHRADIHHPPWQIRKATADLRLNTMAAVHGIALPDQAPLLHFSARQHVVIWPLQELQDSHPDTV